VPKLVQVSCQFKEYQAMHRKDMCLQLFLFRKKLKRATSGIMIAKVNETAGLEKGNFKANSIT